MLNIYISGRMYLYPTVPFISTAERTKQGYWRIITRTVIMKMVYKIFMYLSLKLWKVLGFKNNLY